MQDTKDIVKDIWKEYGRTRPGHRAVHHLMAIHHLIRERGYATSTGVAYYLNVPRAGVPQALGSLVKSGLVVVEPNGRYRLSPDGIDVVNTVLAKRDIVTQFLSGVLGMPRLDAMAEACKIEHLLGQEASDRLTTLVGLLTGNSALSEQFRATYAQAAKLCRPNERCEGCPVECRFAIRATEPAEEPEPDRSGPAGLTRAVVKGPE